jgi:hypothetical protein
VRVERIAEASHWVQADAPERVNQLMVDFLLEPMGSYYSSRTWLLLLW